MEKYDEDVCENPFFLKITREHLNIFHIAVAKKALICVPKFKACAGQDISETDAKDHVLIAGSKTYSVHDNHSDDPALTDVYTTLTEKVVLIKDGYLYAEQGFLHKHSVKVLFEETFHSASNDSYNVLCLESFLGRVTDSEGSVEEKAEHNYRHPTTYDECLELLFNRPGGQKLRGHLDKMMLAFATRYKSLEHESVKSAVDIANAHFSKSLQVLLKDGVMKLALKKNPLHRNSLNLALEMYMMNNLHDCLFGVVAALVSGEDGVINKHCRNSSHLQAQDLGIRGMFHKNLPLAIAEMLGISQSKTPAACLLCLKNVVQTLTLPPKDGSEGFDARLTGDDFLPIMVFLIIKSEIPNWTAILVYMRHFHFTKLSDDDECGFFLASLEAALQHIRSGHFSHETTSRLSGQSVGCHSSEGALLESRGGQMQLDMERMTTPSTADIFFQIGDAGSVARMLVKPQLVMGEVNSHLCHPLCSCQRCHRLVMSVRNDVDLVTVRTRGHHGYTALHLAAYFGHGHLVNMLFDHSAVVDATDHFGQTALHLASKRGHWRLALCLLNFGADVVQTDNEGNLALHHACLNGHEDVVNTTHDDHLPALTQRSLHIYEGVELPETWLHPPSRQEMSVTCIETASFDAAEDAGLKKRTIKLFRAIIAGDLNLVKFYLGLDGDASDDDDDDDVSSCTDSSISDMCHPLCLCPRCLVISKTSCSSDRAVAVNVDTPSGHRPLHVAAIHGRDDIMSMLLKHGASINARTHELLAPLHVAACCRKASTMSILISRGAKLNMHDANGDTPLTICSSSGFCDGLSLLLLNGAEVNCANENGNSALHAASSNACVTAVRMLLDHGADQTLQNGIGLTALHVAQGQETKQMLQDAAAHWHP